MVVSHLKFKSTLSLERLEDLETLGHISLYQQSPKPGRDLPCPQIRRIRLYGAVSAIFFLLPRKGSYISCPLLSIKAKQK